MIYNKSHLPDPTVSEAEYNMIKEEKREIKYVEIILAQYPSLKIQEDEKREELIKAVTDKEEFIASNEITLDGLPKANMTSDPTYRKVQQCEKIYDKRIRRIENELHIIRANLRDIEDAVKTLSAIEQYVIKERYLKLGKPTNYFQLAQKLNYSDRQCKRINKGAIKKIYGALKRCPSMSLLK